MLRFAVAMMLLGVAAPSARAQAYDDPETERVLCKLDGSCPVIEEPAVTTEAPAPIVVRPARRPFGLALARHAMVVTLTTETSLGRDAMLDRTSLAPDLAYGLTDRVTLSLVHSGFATTGFRGSAGGGVCAHGCAHAYNNAGFDALVDLVRGPVALAAVAGVHALAFDSMTIDVKLGAQAAYQAGALTATLSPSVFLGITDRATGNEGSVFVPASLGVQLSRSWFTAVGGGVATPLAAAGDGWTARAGVIARYRVRTGVFVAGSVFLPKLAGGTAVDGTGLDARVANVWVTLAR